MSVAGFFLGAASPRLTRPRPRLLAQGAAATIAILVILELAGPLAALLRAPDALAREAAVFALWELRLPRLLATLLAGSAFGLAGALFQAATRNPLASPDLLGVAAGAQFGVLLGAAVPALAPVAGPPLLFLCGLATASVAIAAAGGWRASALRLILAGGACSLLFGSIVTFILAMFEQNVAGVALWSGGSLYQPGAAGLKSAALWALASLAPLPFLLRPLSALSLGDDVATALGAPVRPARFVAAGAATGLTAVGVAVAGPIGFIGLIAPNLARAAGAYRLGEIAALSALTGAALLLAADALVLAVGFEAGVSTAVAIGLIGTPLLLALILRNRTITPADHGEAVAAAKTRPAKRFAFRLAALLAALMAFGVMWGEDWLSPARLFEAALGHDPVSALIFDIRAPRLVVAAAAGAMLAASGVILQSVMRNALAGPELIGVTQGAALLALSALIAFPFLGRVGAFAFALAGGLGSLGLIVALNFRRRLAPLPVALTGLALGGLFAALTTALIVQTSAQPARALVWLVGGTYGRSWADAAALLPWLAVAVPVLFLLARPLDMLGVGEDAATSLGVPVAPLRALSLFAAATLASAAVAIVGPIGFVGLVAPHLARLLGFHRHGARFLVAMLIGALVAATADILGRALLAPTEIPAGAITALVGGPYFLWLLMRRGQKESAA
ncbi:iron ABC transporter permease [Methylocella sp.]|uniref:iron ABC transporter permease n=1 Tax=Methylocella sp. TaxID=1978226 RepID=UPI003783B1B6